MPALNQNYMSKSSVPSANSFNKRTNATSAAYLYGSNNPNMMGNSNPNMYSQRYMHTEKPHKSKAESLSSTVYNGHSPL